MATLSSLSSIIPKTMDMAQSYGQSDPMLEQIRKRRMEREEQNRKNRETQSTVLYRKAQADGLINDQKSAEELQKILSSPDAPRIRWQDPKLAVQDLHKYSSWLLASGNAAAAKIATDIQAQSRKHYETAGGPDSIIEKESKAELDLKRARTEESKQISEYYKNVPRSNAPQPTPSTIALVMNAIENNYPDDRPFYQWWGGLTHQQKIGYISPILTEAERSRAKNKPIDYNEAARLVFSKLGVGTSQPPRSGGQGPRNQGSRVSPPLVNPSQEVPGAMTNPWDLPDIN